MRVVTNRGFSLDITSNTNLRVTSKKKIPKDWYLIADVVDIGKYPTKVRANLEKSRIEEALMRLDDVFIMG